MPAVGMTAGYKRPVGYKGLYHVGQTAESFGGAAAQYGYACRNFGGIGVDVVHGHSAAYVVQQ